MMCLGNPEGRVSFGAIVRMDSFRYRNAETAGSECK